MGASKGGMRAAGVLGRIEGGEGRGRWGREVRVLEGGDGEG